MRVPVLPGATITGTVTDAAGKAMADIRVDHPRKAIVVVRRTDLAVPPSAAEIRTDAQGHFSVTTEVQAIVIRKPGYESRRVPGGGPFSVRQPSITAKRAKWRSNSIASWIGFPSS